VKKTSHPLASIQLDAPQHTDLAQRESPVDFSLGEVLEALENKKLACNSGQGKLIEGSWDAAKTCWG
jgi:hypothetical protein